VPLPAPGGKDVSCQRVGGKRCDDEDDLDRLAGQMGPVEQVLPEAAMHVSRMSAMDEIPVSGLAPRELRIALRRGIAREASQMRQR
jgi:hypothetical protein